MNRWRNIWTTYIQNDIRIAGVEGSIGIFWHWNWFKILKYIQWTLQVNKIAQKHDVIHLDYRM